MEVLKAIKIIILALKLEEGEDKCPVGIIPEIMMYMLELL